MVKLTIEYRIHVAWWVPIYVRSVAVFCVLFQTQPNTERIVATIKRGVRVEFVR